MSSRFIFLLALSGCAVAPREAAWPAPLASEQRSGDDARVVEQPVCVGARSWSAGVLGDTVLFRTRRQGNRITVGYFVYWSEERPWGDNSLSYTVLPALAVDGVYSHFLYVFPGLKDALYGAGDVEGAQVSYEQRADGSLDVLSGRADDGNHGAVVLSRADLLDKQGRVVLLTDVWSHQLGAHGAASLADRSELELKCYEKSSLRPMTELVARAFRLGSDRKPLRGKPAWLDAEPAEGHPPAEQFAQAKERPRRQ
ncbi:MAG TPA: hypothetical protein VFK05_27675 [Polyangiaceae bacterium]|nr:hypothetical protein [Polyangiaceae bacterium]